jgi:DNA-binding transcriptional MocR family regulator
MTPRMTARRMARELGEWRSAGPAYQALADRVRVLVLDGRIGVGTGLPAERELSVALDVSRTTVAAAYAQLRSDGYLLSVRGSGSTVALPGGHRGSPDPDPGAALDFTKATLPAYPGLAAAFARATERLPRYLDHPGFDLVGLPELRAALAQLYTDRGVPTSPDQIMVTVGAQHALSLVTRALYTPGERVLVELPTYPHALDTFTAAGARLLGLPVSAEEGWNMAEAQLLMRRAAPSLAFVMPDFQNPTGLSMTGEDRERLAWLAGREGTTLVADETTAWLDIDRGPRPPLAASSAQVISLGSLGKLAWGGLRIGWIRAPREVLARILRIRPSLDLGTPMFEQLVALELLNELPLLQASRAGQLRAGRDALVELLGVHLPHWRVHVPDGGMSLWINTGSLSTSALSLAARAEGLALVPGPRFGLDGAFERFLRLPFSYPPADLADGVAILAGAAQQAGGTALRVPQQSMV